MLKRTAVTGCMWYLVWFMGIVCMLWAVPWSQMVSVRLPVVLWAVLGSLCVLGVLMALIMAEAIRSAPPGSAAKKARTDRKDEEDPVEHMRRLLDEDVMKGSLHSSAYEYWRGFDRGDREALLRSLDDGYALLLVREIRAARGPHSVDQDDGPVPPQVTS